MTKLQKQIVLFLKQKGKLKVTILGSGTSQGIPVIACDCDVCLSTDPKDNRLRASIMFTIDDKNYVIDTGPDFRQQMLRENVQSLEAVIFTHEHKDHVAGLDDVRAFNFKQNRDMPIYCDEQVELALKREFYYVFNGNNYPGIPQLSLNIISKNNSFFIAPQTEIIPIEVLHYKMPVLGFRIGKFAYITDAKTVSEEELTKLNLDVANKTSKTLKDKDFSANELAVALDINPDEINRWLMGRHSFSVKILNLILDRMQIILQNQN